MELAKKKKKAGGKGSNTLIKIRPLFLVVQLILSSHGSYCFLWRRMWVCLKLANKIKSSKRNTNVEVWLLDELRFMISFSAFTGV